MKKLSSRYVHTHCLYYFHINTNDPNNLTQGQVQRWVTLIYCSTSQRLIEEKAYHHDISTPTILP